MSIATEKAPVNVKVLIADFQLLCAASMYGFGFAAQRAAMIEGMGPLTFNACRYVVSMILLAVVMPWLSSKPREKDDKEEKVALKEGETAVTVEKAEDNEMRKAWKFGLALAFLNFGASTFQQIGIQYISASEAAFVTGFYIVFTPFMSLLFPVLSGGHKPKWNTWLAVAGSMLGLFIISGSSLDRIGLGKGEILTVICSFFWTFHIMLTDYATNEVDAVYLTFVQFIGTATMTSMCSYYYEYQEWNVRHIWASWHVIVGLGIMECIGFTIGAIGQTNAPSFHAAIIYGSEAVFATIGGFFFLGESFNLREWIGCALMLASTIIAKLEFESEDKAHEKRLIKD